MSTDRLFMTSPAIDGRDEIEDYWLKNRDYVLSIPQVSTELRNHLFFFKIRGFPWALALKVFESIHKIFHRYLCFFS